MGARAPHVSRACDASETRDVDASDAGDEMLMRVMRVMVNGVGDAR